MPAAQLIEFSCSVFGGSLTCQQDHKQAAIQKSLHFLFTLPNTWNTWVNSMQAPYGKHSNLLHDTSSAPNKLQM